MKTKRTRYNYGESKSHKPQHAKSRSRAKVSKREKALVMPRMSIVLTMTFLLILGLISTTFSAFISNTDSLNPAQSGGLIASVNTTAVNQGSNLSINRSDKQEIAVTGANTTVSDGSLRLYFQFRGGDTWWNNKTCYHFAWVWGNNMTSQICYLYKVGTTSNESTGSTSDVFYMNVPSGTLTGFRLLRGKSSSDPVDGSTGWSNNFYNRTGDITLSSNIGTYNLITSVKENKSTITQNSTYKSVSVDNPSVSFSGATSGSGTSSDPYIINNGSSVTVTPSASISDSNFNIQYGYNSTTYTSSTSATFTPSNNVTNGTYTVNFRPRLGSTSNYGTVSSKTVYYSTVSPAATYTVSYNANTGTGAPSSQTKVENVPLTLTTDVPTKTGYRFVGWNTNSSGTGTSYASGATYSANANVTLYAQWQEISYKTVYVGVITYIEDEKKYTPTLHYLNDSGLAGDVALTSLGTTRDYDVGYWSSAQTFRMYSAQVPEEATKYKTFKADGNKDWASETIQISDADLNSTVLLVFEYGGTFHNVTKTLNITVTWKNGTTTLYTESNYSIGDTPSYKGATPTKAATAQYTYTFSGWSPTVSALTNSNLDGVTYTAQFNQTLRTYTVSFKNNYSSTDSSNYKTQSVNYGGKATRPTPDPTRDGYDFGGWYTTSGCTTAYDFTNSTITAATNIYAKWTLKTYTVTYNKNTTDTVSGMPSNGTKSHGVAYTIANAPTRAGYEFLGWNTSATGTGTSYAAGGTYSENADLTLYAMWKKRFDVTASASPSSCGSTSVTYNPDNDRFTVTATANTGYHFVNWTTVSGTYTVNSGSVNTSSMTITASSNVSLTANFAPDVYSITYRDQNSDTTFSGTQSGAPTQHTYGTATTLKSPTRTGYTFGGWYTNKACTGTSVGSTLSANGYTGNITLWAKWTINYYTVTFDNLSHGTKPGNQSVPHGSKATKPAALTQTGYTFGGWYTDSACTTAYNFNSAVTSSFTLYAKWTANTYTVTLNTACYKNGVTGITTSATQVTYPGTVTLTANLADGYSLDKWTINGSYEFVTGNLTSRSPITIRPAANITVSVTAKQTQDTQVYFKSNSGMSTLYMWDKASENGAATELLGSWPGTQYTNTATFGDNVAWNDAGIVEFTNGNNFLVGAIINDGSWKSNPSTKTDDINVTSALYNGSTWRGTPAIWIDSAGNVTTRTDLIELIDNLRTDYNNGVNPDSKFTTESWNAFKNAYVAAVTASGENTHDDIVANQSYIDNAKDLLQQKYDELELKTYFSSPSALSLKKIYSTSIQNIINFNTTVILKYGFSAPYVKTIKHSFDGVNFDDVDARIETLSAEEHNYSLKYAANKVQEGIRYMMVEVESQNGERKSVLVAKTLFGTEPIQGTNNIYLKAPSAVPSDCRVMACFDDGEFEYWSTMQSMGSNKYRVVQPTDYNKVTFYYMYNDKYFTSKDGLVSTFCYAQSSEYDITDDTKRTFNISSVSAGTDTTIGTIHGEFGVFN